MTLNATLLEHPASAAAADPRIAVAETWLCMLGGLNQIARRFCQFLFREIPGLPHRPGAPIFPFRFFGDPRAAFSRVNRALRFIRLVARKIETELAALRAGAPLGPDAFLSRAAPDEEGREDLEERENLIEREAPEREAPERFPFLNDWDRPTPEDKYQALLKGPLKDAIAQICEDLGLNPDWSLWTAKGFPAPPGGEVEDWVAFFAPDATLEAISAHWERQPAPPPPRYDGEGGRDRPWSPGWPPPDHPEPAPPYRHTG